tara:strand:- start:14072 stop:14398 length:327 start_codon:yes stop_codon:yes gene_type:complete
MALIACPECAREISDQAAVCPGCGVSIASQTSTESNAAPKRPVTIEETGKKYKKQMLLSAAMTCVGVIWAVGSANTAGPGEAGGPALLIFFGLMWFIGARIAAWWNHG